MGFQMNIRNVVLFSCLTCYGCNFQVESIPKTIDLNSFSWIGSTLFADPPTVSMKEVHLESTLLLGREVIVEGKVIELGDFGTYLVLADEGARMLVVITEIGELELRPEDIGQANIRVLGSVNNGKKGLPYIQARAYTKVLSNS